MAQYMRLIYSDPATAPGLDEQAAEYGSVEVRPVVVFPDSA